MRLYCFNNRGYWPDQQYMYYVIAENVDDAVQILKKLDPHRFKDHIFNGTILEDGDRYSLTRQVWVTDMGEVRRGGFNYDSQTISEP